MDNPLRTAVLGMAFFVLLTQCAYAFEPSDYLQWDQEPRLSASVSLRGFAINDEPTQLNKPRTFVKSLTQWGIDFQYRLIEVPDWKAKFECYGGTIFLTHWDVPDRVRFKFECGPTYRGRYRLEFGYQKDLNIGISSGDRGMGAYWVGASVKIGDAKDFFADAYGRYFLESSLPAHLSNHFGKASDGIIGEIGVRAKYDLSKYVSIFATPYVLFHNHGTPGLARIGAFTGLRFHVGKLKYVPDGIHIELGGHYNANTDFKYDEKQVWVGITWRFQ